MHKKLYNRTGMKMKKIVYKSKAIQAVIVIAAVCLLASLWPLRIWQEQVSTEVALSTGTVTEVINEIGRASCRERVSSLV